MDGEIIRANLTFTRWSGHTVDELLGRRFSRLLATGSQLFYDTRCLPVLLLSGELREVLLVLERPVQEALPILVNVDVIRDEHDRPRLMRIAVFDASARRDYERELLHARLAAERSEARVRVLQEASVSLGAGRTVASAAAALADIMRSASDAASATVMLVDDDSLQLDAATPVSAPSPDAVRIDAQRPEAEVFRRRETITVPSLSDMERRYPDMVDALHQARFEAMMVTPLLDDDTCLGVVVLLYGRRREFLPEQIELHSALARQGAQALRRVRLQLQLRDMALHDQLTGLANRELLSSQLMESIRLAEQSGRPMSVMFLDLDGFKPINDQLGHAAGDRVLVEVARRIRSVVRDGNTIARFGGDEFVVLLDDCGGHDAEEISRRIGDAIRQPFAGIRDDLRVTASIGVACLAGGRAADGDALLHAADGAMYRSKAAGTDKTTIILA
jgi:diguanylate cyclase (GGDEF)-like protein